MGPFCSHYSDRLISRQALLPSLLAMLLGTAGCGLGDYEKRIDEQARRLKQIDEELAYLGEPLRMPWYKTKDDREESLLPLEVFVRPPKGMDKDVKDFCEFQTLRLYRYPALASPTAAPTRGASFANLFVAAALIARDAKEKAKEGEMTPDEFRYRVRGALIEFCRREFKQDVLLPGISPTSKRTIQPASWRERLPDQEFETLYYPPDAVLPSHFFLFFTRPRLGNEQVAVVYQVYAKDAREPDGVLEVSLKSLGLGSDATRKLMEWRSRRR